MDENIEHFVSYVRPPPLPQYSVECVLQRGSWGTKQIEPPAACYSVSTVYRGEGGSKPQLAWRPQAFDFFVHLLSKLCFSFITVTTSNTKANLFLKFEFSLNFGKMQFSHKFRRQAQE